MDRCNDMKYVIAIALYVIYWCMCLVCTGSDKKNLTSIYSYPDEVIERVRHSPQFSGRIPAQKPLWQVLAANLILFTVIFALLGRALKDALALYGYGEAFAYFVALGEGLNLFDLIVIDLMWWRNSSRIRFSILPEKQPYQYARKHIMSFARGIPVFAAAAALAA